MTFAKYRSCHGCLKVWNQIKHEKKIFGDMKYDNYVKRQPSTQNTFPSLFLRLWVISDVYDPTERESRQLNFLTCFHKLVQTTPASWWCPQSPPLPQSNVASHWLRLLVLLGQLMALISMYHVPLPKWAQHVWHSGSRLNKKDGLTRYGDSHVKDKTS